MIISVEAECSTRLDAELATAHVELVAEDTDRQQAMRRAQETARHFLGEVEQLRPGAEPAVTTVAVRTPRTWTQQQFDGQGQPSTALHRVEIPVEVTFRDIAALSAHTAAWGEREGVQVGHVAWELTERTRQEQGDAMLLGAIEEATRRAQVMARAAGAGEPRLLQLGDPGTLGDGPAPEPMMKGLAAGRSMAQAVEVTAQVITVTGRVQARYEA